jgi:glycosyltransferase involved in cell wall biosynthesis
MKQPDDVILTIGVPVYNGALFIADLLDSITISTDISHKIEILVSDNCSTDNTADVVKSFSHVTYCRNDENVGYDRNAYNIFQKAKGKYVWTIGSDDVIIGNSTLSFLVDILESQDQIGVVHVGGSAVIPNLHKVYDKDEQFFLDSKFQSGFASSNIVNREMWLGTNPSQYFGTGWVHFGVILRIVNHSITVVTKEKLVDENPRFSHLSKSWDLNGSSLTIMLELVKIFNQSSKRGYSRNFSRKAKLLIKAQYPKEIIKCKAKGLHIGIDLVKEFISCYKLFPSFWLIDLPALLLPRRLCGFIYNQRKTINNAS